MKTVTLVLTVLSSMAALAQSVDGGSQSVSTQQMVAQASKPSFHGADIQEVIREVIREQQAKASAGGASASGEQTVLARPRVDVYFDTMDNWDEHSVEDLMMALKYAGYHEEDALTFHMHQEMDEVRQTMAKRRALKAAKMKLQFPINELRDHLGDNHNQGGGSVVSTDEKGYRIADRLLDTVRIDGGKIRFKVYSYSSVDGNRDVSFIRRNGEKPYLEARLNHNINGRLYYGVGANLGQVTESGKKDSRLVFYVSGKMNANNRLTK